MELGTSRNKIWYRLIKVIFVISLILTEAVGIFAVHSITSERRPLTLAEVIYSGGIVSKPGGGISMSEFKDLYSNDSQNFEVRAVLMGAKPSNSQISDADFQTLQSNIQKMIKAGVKNQMINYYTDFTLQQQVNQGSYIEPLPDKPRGPDKYSLAQKITYYLEAFFIILFTFWLFSRIFYYVIFGESFLKLKP